MLRLDLECVPEIREDVLRDCFILEHPLEPIDLHRLGFDSHLEFNVSHTVNLQDLHWYLLQCLEAVINLYLLTTRHFLHQSGGHCSH